MIRLEVGGATMHQKNGKSRRRFDYNRNPTPAPGTRDALAAPRTRACTSEGGFQNNIQNWNRQPNLAPRK